MIEKLRSAAAAVTLVALVAAPGIAQLKPAGAAATALAPFKAGNRFFTPAGTGGLAVREGESGPSRALFAAGSFSAVAPSPNGKYVAYVPLGSNEIRIRDVASVRDLPDVLHSSRLSRVPWTHNERGFFYTRIDSADHRERVYYHAVGRAESSDPIVLSQFDHPEWRYETTVSDDGQYAVFQISHPVDNDTRIYFIDLNDPDKPKLNNPVVKLAESSDAHYEFVDNAGTFFFLKTDRNAPRGRVVLADIDVTREDRWRPVVAETADTLSLVRTFANQYVATVYHTSAGDTVALLGPPDPDKVRNEMRKRLDSLRKAQRDSGFARNQSGHGNDRLFLETPALRLESHGGITVPPHGVVVAMNSVADADQLFYTVRLPDGSMQSYMYNVKRGRSEPFPSGQQAGGK